MLELIQAALLENRTIGESQSPQRCPRAAPSIDAAAVEIYREGFVEQPLRLDRVFPQARRMSVHDDRAIVVALRLVVDAVPEMVGRRKRLVVAPIVMALAINADITPPGHPA